MKPIKQLVLHDPESGRWGDCWRACIASILDMHAHEVPHFLHDGCDYETCLQRINAWLRGNKLFYIEFSFPGNIDFSKYIPKDACYVLAGKSPRFCGISHCVVARGNYEVVHDPHPDGINKLDQYDDSSYTIGLVSKLSVMEG